ncbi:hypothetical protein SmJEL517_g04501 [Synchytrium microbalum]|uniref:DM10 domain-containing protein n=1 Tax=Synchytrium microbalum TaxID=1806994 RepID=A0A507BRM2_9FUNG|nr:uncharacterized protein SmJEL517_g04501 [Synchytrium microbalum]TPX32330.1 hypothetical protein SmJEL517_g04501 [Synchytrium microbalum]
MVANTHNTADVPKASIPFLPGNSFGDATKTDFRKAHTLDYKNSYALQKQVRLSIGGVAHQAHIQPSAQDLLQWSGKDPAITYGDKQFHAPKVEPRFVPAYVAFDKVVLRFDAYFKQAVHESREQFHLRRVRILYYLEDDSVAVVEPEFENSGILQGVLIKRQRLPKSSTEYYRARDFNLGINLQIYGRTYRVVNCDKFTEQYMRETENIILNAPEDMPTDQYIVSRERVPRNPSHSVEKHDLLKRFLENDRKVLRFYCVWDDRDSMFGELREFVLHYFLVDDCCEVREVQKPNNGRDPSPILVRRQHLNKDGSANENAEVYTWRDFQIGQSINVLGRKFLLRDCDDYTRRFYQTTLGVSPSSLVAIPVETTPQRVLEPEVPPYNGYGDVEDSLGSCRYLVLKPPKKDFLKALENEHKVLRFVARMDSKHKEDKDRRFVISYRLADDTMTIYEPPQRNAGILGGKFMERKRVLLPGSALSDAEGPKYYKTADLNVGATVEVLKHKFVLLDADEFVYQYMEDKRQDFPMSDINKVMKKASVGLAGCKNVLAQVAKRLDSSDGGVVDRKKFLEATRDVWGSCLTYHEAITLSRAFEEEDRQVSYVKMLSAF